MPKVDESRSQELFGQTMIFCTLSDLESNVMVAHQKHLTAFRSPSTQDWSNNNLEKKLQEKSKGECSGSS